MSTEYTLSIIKPNAVNKNVIGKIITKLEENDLKIIASKMIWMTEKDAEEFYSEHKGKDFFKRLVDFTTSSPCIIQVLKGENAILKNREIMGATDYRKAAPGTIRAEFADGLTENGVHGSDSIESAMKEIAFFFSEREIFRTI